MLARMARSALASAAFLFVGSCPAAVLAASATVTWSAVPEVDGYKIYYDVDAGPPYQGTEANEGESPIEVPVTSLSDSSAPELELTGLTTCEVYYFAVTAYDASGESDYSPAPGVAVMDAPDPVTVSQLTPEALEVHWAGLPAADPGAVRSYEVHYDTDSGEPYRGPGSPIVVVPSTLSDPDDPSFVLSSLSPGTTYYIAVRTVCAGDEGAMSEEVAGTLPGGGTGGSGTGGSGTGNTNGTGATSSAGGAATSQDPFEPDVQNESGGCRLRRGSRDHASVALSVWLVLGLALGLARRRGR